MRVFADVSWERTFCLLSCLLLSLRLGLAGWMPYTGDELSTLQRASTFSEPLLGWWIAFALQISDHPLLLRLPQVFMPFLTALGMLRIFKGEEEELGYAAAFAWLLLPPQVIDVELSGNTVLVSCAFLSLACFYVGVRDDDNRFHALAGLFLGLAYLSQQIAALLGLAYAFFALTAPRRELRWIDLSVLSLCALPFVALWWGDASIPVNGLVHVDTRAADTSASWRSPLLFLAAALFAVGPFLPWRLARRPGLLRALRDRPAARAMFVCASLLFGMLMLRSVFVSTRDLSGLYALPLIIATALLVGREALLQHVRWMSGLSLVLLLLHVFA